MAKAPDLRKRELAERFGLMDGGRLPGLEAVVDLWRDRSGLLMDPSSDLQEYRVVPRRGRGFAYRLLGSYMEKHRREDSVLAALELLAGEHDRQGEAVAQMALGVLEVVTPLR